MLARFFDNHGPPPKAEKFYIHFHRTGKRLMDRDNLVFMGKPWLDVLQEKFNLQSEDVFEDKIEVRPVIRDDSPGYCALEYSQETGDHYKVSILLVPYRSTNASL